MTVFFGSDYVTQINDLVFTPTGGQFGPDVTGRFYASKPKKMTGPIEPIELDHFDNPDAQRALWEVASKVAGGVEYPV